MPKKTIEEALTEPTTQTSTSVTETDASAPETVFDKKSRFIELYYGIDSKHRYDLQKCSELAGYSSLKAPRKIIDEHSQGLMLHSALETVGVNKMTIALRLKKLLASKSTKDREILAAAKMILSAAGETVEGNKQNAVNLNVQTGPKSLVLVGWGDEVGDMLKGKKKEPEPVSAALELPAPENSNGSGETEGGIQ